MKKIKQILALIGVVLLVCMYAATLIFALIDSPCGIRAVQSLCAATILVPVLLYAFILVARLLKDHNYDQKDDHSDI